MKKFINREISWLSFNGRVLQVAADENTPLIERIKFLRIFSNNLDDLFRVRVTTLKWLLKADIKSKALIGDRRIEVMCPIYDRRIQAELREALYIQLRDNVRARILNREQNNRYRQKPGVPPVQAQVDTYRLLKQKHGNHVEESG